MHRMRTLFARAGLTVACALGLGKPTSAELIRPKEVRAYPDIAADISGVQTYTFDPVSQTGTFQVVNTPYLLALDPSKSGETQIEPNDDGTRRQVVSLTLDRQGRLVDDPANSYALYGTVVLGGRVFSGLLLEGKPTAFGARVRGSNPDSDPGAVGPAETGTATRGDSRQDVFDLNMKITGGALAGRFGSDLYMRVVPRADTFDGQFTRDFSGRSARSNTRAYQASKSVAEPSTLLLLLTGGAALVLGHRRLRIVRDETAASRKTRPSSHS
jgi:hypothetical protein